MIILPILTASPARLLFKGWENVLLNLGVKGIIVANVMKCDGVSDLVDFMHITPIRNVSKTVFVKAKETQVTTTTTKNSTV